MISPMAGRGKPRDILRRSWEVFEGRVQKVFE
jgi:hypothetical protein